MSEDELRFRVSYLLDVNEGLQAEICELKAIQIRQENEIAQWKTGKRRIWYRFRSGCTKKLDFLHRDGALNLAKDARSVSSDPDGISVWKVTVGPKGDAK